MNLKHQHILHSELGCSPRTNVLDKHKLVEVLQPVSAGVSSIKEFPIRTYSVSNTETTNNGMNNV